jgi:hypothetical protein
VENALMDERTVPMPLIRKVGVAAYQVGRWGVEFQAGAWRASPLAGPRISILFPTLARAHLALTGQRLIPIRRRQPSRSAAYQARERSFTQRKAHPHV